MTIPSSVKQIQAGDWPEYVKTLKDYRPFVTTFDGTYFDVVLQDGSHQLIIVTDLNGFADIRGNKTGTQTLINSYNTLQPILSTDTLLGVRIGGSISITGTVTANQGTPGASPWLVNGPAGGINVNPYSATFDGANNAYASFTVTNAAQQLISSGTLYKILTVQSIDPTDDIFFGFDNLVTSTNFGFAFKKASLNPPVVLYGFNGNLWAISNLANVNVNVGVLGRG